MEYVVVDVIADITYEAGILVSGGVVSQGAVQLSPTTDNVSVGVDPLAMYNFC